MSKIDFDSNQVTSPPSESLYQAIVEQSSDVTIVLNSTGQLRYISPAVFAVFGFCPESAPLAEFLHWFERTDREALSRTLQSFLVEPQIIYTRLRHHRGYWVDCSVAIQNLASRTIEQLGESPLDDKQLETSQTSESLNGTYWYLMSLRPMTAGLHNSDPVDEIAREDAQTKSHFLAIMSHELRTPINAINGFSQLLLRQRRDRLSPEQEDMVQRILTNGKNLLSLINNVLDLSKLEAGRINLQLEQLNVANLIEATVQGISSLAMQNDLTLTTEIHLTNPVIENDPLRLRQILLNLLSNAIKFSEGGQVWIIVEDCEPSSLMISVQDTGPGIASDDIEQVFSEFWQVDQLPSRHHQGTGLGLAISQNLAKMMQGEIQVHSQLGHGATFRLVIPRELSARD